MKNKVQNLRDVFSKFSLWLMCSIALCATTVAHAQKGIGVDNPTRSSALEVKADNRGILIPRVALKSLDNFEPITGVEGSASETNSLLVYNTATAGSGDRAVKPGYYYWTTADGRWNRLITTNDEDALQLTGDIVGPLNQNRIDSIQGKKLEIEDLKIGDVLVYDDDKWVNKQAAMPKFFYMPSVIMYTDETQLPSDAAYTYSDGIFTVNLYALYIAQFGLSDDTSSISSAGSDHELPTLGATELIYNITWYDNTVFTEVGVSDEGELTYEVKSDADVNIGTFMNIVFEVK